MDSNLLSIIKKEKENLVEDKNDNYLRLSCDVHVKVENGLDDCLQSSDLLNNQQETFNYNNFKEEEIQSCCICSENFINSYSLYRHNLIHLKVPIVQLKLFICGVCSNFYKTKKQLKNHITKAHKDKTLSNRVKSSKARLYKCKVCNKELTYKTWFDHQKNVHARTKVQCDKCNKLFKCKRYLKRHILYVHEGVLVPWRFRRAYHKDITQNAVQCPKCPTILSCKSSLTTHLKNSHSEKTFQCKICKSVLKSKPYLSTHMQRVHYDDGMMHRCDVCGKSFKSPRYVRVHKKNSHTYLI